MFPPTDSIAYTTTDILQQRLDDPDLSIIDIRVPEAYGEEHIRNAVNFCIYEVIFLEEIAKSLPDKKRAIVVYGESAEFKAAEVAFGRLKDAGYMDLAVLSGGITAWRETGGTTEGDGNDTDALEISGRYELGTDKSTLRWIGRNLTNQHDGKIAIKSGWLAVNESACPIGGELVLDMNRITCDDIADPTMNKALISHLSNDDFFKVDAFPQANFTFVEAAAIEGATPGQPNYSVTGDMTLRGITLPISFTAMVNPVTDGIAFQAQFNVNRVDFGVVYGSGSLFERLGMHLVNDLVNIQITAVFG